MRALIDTNILIYRETKNPPIEDIGTLFFWLNKLKYDVYIHPITKDEIFSNKNKDAVRAFKIKMDSYNLLRIPKNVHPDTKKISLDVDDCENDLNDTLLLDEVYCDRVDIFITEDKKIHLKAKLLGISDKVFHISSFLKHVNKITPGLVSYDILEIKIKFFSEIDLNDSFFDSFKQDYPFEKWFSRKYAEKAYTLTNNVGKMEAFLYLKVENKDENYSDINPIFLQKKRLKIGTLKVANPGMRVGERFLKIIFDNAKKSEVDEIYLTIFKKSDEQIRLIKMIEEWGFVLHGTKNNGELVYVRKCTKDDNTPVNRLRPKLTYPFISQKANFYMISIQPQFHTDLFPDSILRGEAKEDFSDSAPHRNAISKSYVTSSKLRDLKCGDGIVFYRSGGRYKGVATTIGIVEDILLDIKDEDSLIRLTRKRTVFTEQELRTYFKERKTWSKEYKPFVINFLYVGSLIKRLNLDKMIELNIIDKAPWGIAKISRQAFKSLIVDNI